MIEREYVIHDAESENRYFLSLDVTHKCFSENIIYYFGSESL